MDDSKENKFGAKSAIEKLFAIATIPRGYNLS